MAAILMTDFFLLRKDSSQMRFDTANLCVWAVGFAVYRFAMRLETPVGSTLPAMAVTALLCFAINKIGGMKNA